jgi:6-bladed beta-propeller protein
MHRRKGRRHARVTVLLTMCIGIVGCDSYGGPWREYSLAPEHSRFNRSQFPDSSRVQLETLRTVGVIEGAPERSFSAISDVGIDASGSIFVLDPKEHRVVVFDSGGRFVRIIGKTGGGPGEFLGPTKVVVEHDSIIVFDRGQLRVSVFAKDGRFGRQFSLDRSFLETLASDGQGGLLLTEPGGSARAAWYSRDGTLRRAYPLVARIDSEVRGPWLPAAGAVCSIDQGRTFLIANPWILELVALASGGDIRWARRWRSNELSPKAPDMPGVSPKIQRAVVLGLACSDHLAVLGYLDRPTRRIFYDFFAANGELIGRRIFAADDSSHYFGVVAALEGDRLVTYRNRPYPQVYVHRVVRR